MDGATRAASESFADKLGLHLVCPIRACRRGRRCRDPERDAMPFCFALHRGTVRFWLAVATARLGLEPGRPAAPSGDGPAPAAPVAPPAADTMLGLMAARGVPIGRLMRGRDDPADEWTWERSPEAVALVRAAGTRPLVSGS